MCALGAKSKGCARGRHAWEGALRAGATRGGNARLRKLRTKRLRYFPLTPFARNRMETRQGETVGSRGGGDGRRESGPPAAKGPAALWKPIQLRVGGGYLLGN